MSEQNVQVTQADREAAAACIERGVSHPHPEDVLSGAKDDWFFVQAFARHRTRAEPDLVEAAERVVYYVNGPTFVGDEGAALLEAIMGLRAALSRADGEGR